MSIRAGRTEAGRTARQRGNALLAVIAIVAVLAALGIAYQAAVDAQSRTNDALAARIAEQAAVDAATTLGVWRAAADWRARPAEIALTAIRCRQDGFDVEVNIEDEAARLNLNLADEFSILRELDRAGVSPATAPAIAARIADAVDRDSVTSRGGSEAEDFAAAKALSPPRNAPFDLIEEVRAVPGVDDATFDKIAQTFSLHSPRSDRLSTEGGDARAPPRGVYRITALIRAADGVHAKVSRTAVIELDPAASFEPQTRVWSRAALQRRANSESRPSEKACREAILSE